ncbi:hypothetical protein BYT27DRAFT_7192680 [Phlegmacium glaucopus]|nr:hypothetical protein BYT27DRAFT_7192680 [Phlegmacium glaucopus]
MHALDLDCETMVFTWQRRSVFKSWISLCLYKDLKEAPRLPAVFLMSQVLRVRGTRRIYHIKQHYAKIAPEICKLARREILEPLDRFDIGHNGCTFASVAQVCHKV